MEMNQDWIIIQLLEIMKNIHKNSKDQENYDSNVRNVRPNSRLSINSRNKSRKIIDTNNMRKNEDLTITIKADE